MAKLQKMNYLPPLFRFIMELTAWIYFIVLAIYNDVLYIVVFFMSVSCLAIFNFPGDKKIDGPVDVPGWLRIGNEWFSGGLVSIVGAFLLFQLLGVVVQSILILIVIILDRKRYFWMLGLESNPPVYVSMLRKP
jgi:hypothetical protein